MTDRRLRDLQRLALAGDPRASAAFERARRRVLRRVLTHERPVCGLAFSPDGLLLATLVIDQRPTGRGWLEVWDLWAGKRLHRMASRGKAGPCQGAVVFSQDSRWLYSGWGDGTVRVFDVVTGRISWIQRGPFDSAERLTGSPCGRVFASLESNIASVWTWEGEELFRVGATWRAVFSADGRTLAVNDRSQRYWDYVEMALYDVASGKRTSRWEVFSGDTPELFTPNGRWLIAESSNLEVYTLEGGSAFPLAANMTRPVAVTPDSRLLMGCSGPNHERISIVELRRKGKVLGVLEGHPKWITSLAVSPGGSLLASGSNDGSVRLWDLTPYQG